MSVDQVAEHLGVKVSWVYDNWRRAGIPFRRIGSQLRIRPSELEQWISNQDTAA